MQSRNMPINIIRLNNFHTRITELYHTEASSKANNNTYTYT